MTKINQVGTVATAVLTEGGFTRVVYHNTEVVKFNQDKIILDADRYYTATTKRRMNQASNQFNLGFQVYQSGGEWYVDYNGDTLEFSNGMELTR